MSGEERPRTDAGQVRMDPERGHWAADTFQGGEVGYSYGSGEIRRAPLEADPKAPLPVPVPVKVLDPGLGAYERAKVSQNDATREWEARSAEGR